MYVKVIATQSSDISRHSAHKDSQCCYSPLFKVNGTADMLTKTNQLHTVICMLNPQYVTVLTPLQKASSNLLTL